MREAVHECVGSCAEGQKVSVSPVVVGLAECREVSVCDRVVVGGLADGRKVPVFDHVVDPAESRKVSVGGVGNGARADNLVSAFPML